MNWYVLLVLPLVFPVAAQSQELPRDKWLEAMTVSVPTYFCKPEQYFRQCFEVEAGECEQVALSATRTCLSQMRERIPAVMRQPADGRVWGTRLGNCAGVAYEAALAEKHKPDPRCKDARNWAPG